MFDILDEIKTAPTTMGQDDDSYFSKLFTKSIPYEGGCQR
jgi:hypothetical protein